ncbi:hypothetical protein PDE_00962 [Penicillium oxalicum 114-2]|uniref:Uncharacterized protein n=1 Tax=Penicillium oxalicum (strain 114-2 / CGMCC 5302) TaxID=933388 RepID=S7ZBG3_PENO1|nr:hypothetical protein PDE_00962 [Penicillium oxalicum 114-2]
MRIATLAHADEAKRAKLVELELAGRLHIFDQDFKSALPSRGWEVNLLVLAVADMVVVFFRGEQTGGALESRHRIHRFERYHPSPELLRRWLQRGSTSGAAASMTGGSR